MEAILNMAEDAERRERPDFTDRQEWAQLCCVALADTDLLPSSLRGAITSGDTVSPRVRDAYFLAKYKVFNQLQDELGRGTRILGGATWALR